MENNYKNYHSQQTCTKYKFAVLVLLFCCNFCAMAQKIKVPQPKFTTALTVANIFEQQPNEDFVQLVFLESARFYKVYPANKQYKNIMKMATYSLKNNCKVWVQTTQQNGDIIKNILPLGKK